MTQPKECLKLLSLTNKHLPISEPLASVAACFMNCIVFMSIAIMAPLSYNSVSYVQSVPKVNMA